MEIEMQSPKQQMIQINAQNQAISPIDNQKFYSFGGLELFKGLDKSAANSSYRQNE